ncbi:MAG TPA: methenyltetrahydromethanopterin cyclohydrolase [Methanocella sp.]|nr:methenyltetrahydromethanopterin cyclohydrolase [Methanocella sp.]
MFSINDRAAAYVDELLNREEELQIKSHFLENQSTVIDCGVNTIGGIGAGILYATIAMGGLGRVSLVPGIIDGLYLQFSQIWVDQPAIACLGSQKPGWKLKAEGFTGTAFGPARAIALKPKALYQAIDYSDDAETVFINIEANSLPTAKDMDSIAKQCSTEPDSVVAMVARPGSIAGTIAHSTRAVEWALNRLFQIGYDTKDVISASGVVPVAPTSGADQDCIGISMDAIAYYGMVSLYARSVSDAFKSVTSENSKFYGKSFKALLMDVQGDYSKVDGAMFGPARLMVNGPDGSTKTFGRLDPAMLLISMGLIEA